MKKENDRLGGDVGLCVDLGFCVEEVGRVRCLLTCVHSLCSPSVNRAGDELAKH